MKYLFIAILVFTGCRKEVKEVPKIEIDGSLNITKTEVGFNIYSNNGELILEYTKQNCDSTELKLLDDIYLTAKEFSDKKSNVLYEQEDDSEVKSLWN